MAVDDAPGLEELFAESDRRARERRERRAARRRTRPARKAGPARPAREARHLAGTAAGRVLLVTVTAIAALTIVGLVALWPGRLHHDGPTQAFGGPTEPATVKRVYDVRCPGPTPQRCRQIQVRVGSRVSRITLGPSRLAPGVTAGEAVRVSRSQQPVGARAAPGFEPYQFVDVDRKGSLLAMSLVLAGLALVVLRWRGLLAALGVGLSLAVVTIFVVPAILAGRPALLVALVGSLAVMLVTLVLTNGVGAQTLAAALGITATLLLTCLLAKLAVGAAHLDGHSSDLSLVLGQQDRSLSLPGVVVAGMVIGALGVLADTAVTQASAVMALRRANPALNAASLYRGALAVGRDHLSATIHTLVLAYVGATLPLLLVMRSSALSLGDALNAQDIAEPIAASVIGCICLVAAVPLTTGVASALVSRLPAEAVPHGHGHAH